MRIGWTWIPLLAISCAAQAQLRLLPESEPQAVFGGGAGRLELRWQNGPRQTDGADISIRMFQTSTATAAPIGQWPWKKISAFPEQTIIESASPEFPAVKAETPFLLQWIEGANHVLGTTKVLVYPTNLLEELRPVDTDEDFLGVFDSNDELKPLLAALQIPFVDLEKTGMDSFRGRLALLGPFASKGQMPLELDRSLSKLAANGTGVVWIQPQQNRGDKLKPSFHSVPGKRSAIVVAQPELVMNIGGNPRAQLNLVHLARMALHSEPLRPPGAALQPDLR